MIPCSFSGFRFARQAQIYWFKCNSTQECDNPVKIFLHNSARVSLLDYDKYFRSCSIIISDLTESDSGSYYPQIQFSVPQIEFSSPQRTTVSVKGMKGYSKFTQQAFKNKCGQHICILIYLTKVMLVRCVMQCLPLCTAASQCLRTQI